MRNRKNAIWLILAVLVLAWSPARAAENVGRASRIRTGDGPHIIGLINRESGDSQVAITGTFGDNTSGDNRALGITTTIITNPVTGNRSSEAINLRPSFTLPSSGNIATIEGLHIDLSGAWGPYGNGHLWQPGTSATVGSVHAIRIRGVMLPAGATNYSALTIDAGFGGVGGTSYNIFSNGAFARNRFDGIFEVYGSSGHVIGNYGGPLPYVGLFLSPTVTDNTGGVYGAKGVWISPNLSPPDIRNAEGLYILPYITKKPGGTHSDFASLLVSPPNITTDNTSTVQNISTVKILGAPTEGTANNHALWVIGSVRWDDPIALGGGAAPTFGTIGGSGPAGAAQARWLRVNIAGTVSFIPVWQ